MQKVLSYENMSVIMCRATVDPAEIVGLALAIVMRQDVTKFPDLTDAMAHYILDAEHNSIFEHVQYTFLIENVSRSFLAQITRQRTASPTSGSQHYQIYSDYPCVISPQIEKSSNVYNIMAESFNDCYTRYNKLIDLGVPREEARQVLPNAATVTYLWTIDARNLYNFLYQRLCYRNVEEMQIFSDKVLRLVLQHFPELFKHCGPQCFVSSCRQGKLACGSEYQRGVIHA